MAGKPHLIRLYFPRWFFSNNIGDTIMISSLFKALKERCRTLEVISDRVVCDTFYNDPHVDSFRTPNWFERRLPREWYRKMGGVSLSRKKRSAGAVAFIDRRLSKLFMKKTAAVYVYPEWKERTFAYLRNSEALRDCIESPTQNILSVNFALQADMPISRFSDLRPRIYLTSEELATGRSRIKPNAIGIHIAALRSDQRREDAEGYRYKKESWRTFARELKKRRPEVTIYELGQDRFESIGDEFLPNRSIRETAALLKAIRIVVLSDGGLHNICNAVDVPVLLFQAYAMNPPDLFKMGNARFNESYHLECRKRCHIFSDIYRCPGAFLSCRKECHTLDPMNLVNDCDVFLRSTSPDASGGTDEH